MDGEHEVIHSGDTHTPKNAMSKAKHITNKSNGIYQVRIRIPTDLVNSRYFGAKKTHLSCSLGTRDLKLAEEKGYPIVGKFLEQIRVGLAEYSTHQCQKSSSVKQRHFDYDIATITVADMRHLAQIHFCKVIERSEDILLKGERIENEAYLEQLKDELVSLCDTHPDDSIVVPQNGASSLLVI